MPLNFMHSPSKNIASLPCLSLSLSNTCSRPALCPPVVQLVSKNLPAFSAPAGPAAVALASARCSRLFLDPIINVGMEPCPGPLLSVRRIRLSVCKPSQTRPSCATYVAGGHAANTRTATVILSIYSMTPKAAFVLERRFCYISLHDNTADLWLYQAGT